MNAILKHKSIEISVIKLNKIYKMVIFLVYFIIGPGIDLSFYVVDGNHSMLIFTRILFFYIGSTILCFAFILNYMCASVTKAALKPHSPLHKFILVKKLPAKQKLKIQAFIQHLSETKIGFFCLDLFAMNNREFFEYFCQLIANYFLCMKLIAKVI